MALELRSAALADTHAIAAELAALSQPGDIIVLSGGMGAGKTAFAQGFGRALGVTDPMTSPTFTLVHSYEIDHGPHAGKLTLHHADLYRLERTAEVADLALVELAEFRGIVLVEWGDVIDGFFGDHLVVHLASLHPGHDDDDDDGGNDRHDDDAVTDEQVGDDDVFGLDGSRLIEIAAVGGRWAGRWERLHHAMGRHRC